MNAPIIAIVMTRPTSERAPRHEPIATMAIAVMMSHAMIGTLRW